MDEEQALERIEDLKGFYGHLVAYLATNAFLLVINLITSTDYLWFVFPLQAGHASGLFTISENTPLIGWGLIRQPFRLPPKDRLS